MVLAATLRAVVNTENRDDCPNGQDDRKDALRSQPHLYTHRTELCLKERVLKGMVEGCWVKQEGNLRQEFLSGNYARRPTQSWLYIRKIAVVPSASRRKYCMKSSATDQ